MFDGLIPRPTVSPRWELDDADPINRALLGFWPLNEPGGAIAEDLGPYRQRGTLTNTPTRVVGKIGRAAAFAGGGAGSAHIDVNAKPALVSAQLPLTIAAWVYPTGSGTRTAFAQYWDFSAAGDIGKMIRIESGNVVYYTTSSSSAFQSVTGGAVANSVWSLVVVTVSGPISAPQYAITVNNTTSTGSLGALRAAGPADRPIYLGNSRRNTLFGPGEGYAGHLGPVRVWGRALSTSERLRLLAKPMAGAVDPAARLFFAFQRSATGGAPTDLIATGIATGAPTVGAPSLGQTHTLTATGVATAAPTVGAPALGQTHALTATGIATAAPTVGNPALAQTHTLSATGIATGAPTVGAPAIGQAHALTATGVATGAPTVGSPALGQTHALVASGVATGAPVVGVPAVGQTHILTALGIAAGAPVVGNPGLNIEVAEAIPAPASRTYTWAAHSRDTAWPAHSRAVAWPAHSRATEWQE